VTPAQFKEARKQAGFTQQGLANEWGMGQNGGRTIRRWEDGDLYINTNKGKVKLKDLAWYRNIEYE